MSSGTYLDWVTKETITGWWHDSADPVELQRGLDRGAIGVTTNPYLSGVSMNKNRAAWAADVDPIMAQKLAAEPRAEALMKVVVTKAAAMFQPIHERTGGRDGWVCAQVNPSRAGDREFMLATARRYHTWAPNISVKLPCVASGLDVLEDCIAEGISATATVSFTVPQALAIAERCRAGRVRAQAKGIEPGKCFAVIMIGRLDDYLREVAADNQVAVSEADIRQSGIAATKRAYQIYRERGYEAILLVAALRGPYHLTEMAGADLLMSIAPGPQEWFVQNDYPKVERIAEPVPADVIERLSAMPEFVKAYEPDLMKPAQFISYGVCQRTLSQFVESGWKVLEGVR